MVKEFEAIETSKKHRMIIDPVGFISEIINNIGDQRDIIREFLSNAAAREVCGSGRAVGFRGRQRRKTC